MDLTGHWRTLFVWAVIAAAGLTYLASFKLPVVAAMEQGVVTVSDQLPSLVNDTVSTISTGTGDAQLNITENDTILDPQISQTSSPQEEAAITEETAIDVSIPDAGATLPTSAEPTESIDSANPAPAVSEPLALSPEDELADFMITRVGRLLYGTNNFPAHDVDITGEFVLQIPSIYGSHFNAIKGQAIPTGYSALTSYNDGTMSGFALYKNMTHAPYYDDCYIAMSAGGPVSFNNLSMEVTELYAQELIGVRTFPIIDFWTTNPGEDLPLGEGEIPSDPDDEFYGDDFKVTVIKMTADHIEIPNFSLSVRPGRK